MKLKQMKLKQKIKKFYNSLKWRMILLYRNTFGIDYVTGMNREVAPFYGSDHSSWGRPIGYKAGPKYIYWKSGKVVEDNSETGTYYFDENGEPIKQ